MVSVFTSHSTVHDGGANTSQSGYSLMDNWSIATTGRLYTNWLNGLCIVNEMSQCQLIDYIQTGQRYIVIILVYVYSTRCRIQPSS